VTGGNTVNLGDKKKKIMVALAAIAAVIILFFGYQMVAQQFDANKGADYLKEKEYEKAYTYFQKAEQRYTLPVTKKSVRYYEGESLIYLGRYEEAEKVYDKIIGSQKEARAYAMKGFACQQNGDVQNAVKAYQEAISVDTKNGIGYYYLYGYYIESEEYEKALEIINEAQSVPVTSMKQEIDYAKIVVYEKMLKYDDAKKAAEEYCKTYPEDEVGKQEKEFLETR
jgi:tetratricopeptide (TPR) repeat protein